VRGNRSTHSQPKPSFGGLLATRPSATKGYRADHPGQDCALNTYLPLLTVFVSGLFALAVAAVTAWLSSFRDSRSHARDRARDRFDAIKAVYANHLAYLEKCMRYTERLGDYSELDDLAIVNAQLLLSGSPEVVEQSERCSEFLYHWSTEFRRGSPKKLGDTGLSMVASGESEHREQAKVLRANLDAELTKLLKAMQAHLQGIEP
jgi:hypothetical protein